MLWRQVLTPVQGGTDGDYGARASADLIVTRGAGFRKEKNKKKRGSYKGGIITVSVAFLGLNETPPNCFLDMRVDGEPQHQIHGLSEA